MMSMSFSEVTGHIFPSPVKSLSYRDMGTPLLPVVKEPKPPEPDLEKGKKELGAPALSTQEINDLLNLARIEAVADTEKRLRTEYEAKAAQQAASIRQALKLFQAERKDYFSRVESDVVHLALAIAAKILHREAQVDTMLIAALVRVAVEKLHDGSRVSVRVSPAEAEKWRKYLEDPKNGSTITIIEDAHLGSEDCILETDLGSANFSIDAQLKEVEQGFFDLLAQRPQVK
jgi:flagellar assembly protein FliH